MLGVLHYLEASERLKLVSKVHSEYTITFESCDKDTFQGEAKITFHYTPNKDNAEEGLKYLFVETCATTVSQAAVNGKEMTLEEISQAHNADKKRFYIKPQDPAAEQDITLSATYECPYICDSRTGTHKILSPDQFVIWTDFEPFSSHTMFMCFDQPSIKSTLKISVVAPAGYPSFSNTKEIATTPISDKLVKHEYDTLSVPVSSYLYCIALGDLVQAATSTYTSIHDPSRVVPMSVILPKASPKPMDSENVLDTLQDSLSYYERIFDEPYPFDKYDCVFAPGYDGGAMENPGLVLFSDKYIFDESEEKVPYTRRTETIVHETLHMWLGNLVTPVWWDGLWLSEGFASYFGYDAKRSLRNKPIASERWVDFHNVKRHSCYSAMLESEMHPIQNTPSGDATGTYDTDVANKIFDSISYGKGGAVVKQLIATIGEDNFVKAVREYIKKFRFLNVDYADFKSVFTKYISEDWLDRWLLSKGLSTLIPTLGTDPTTGHVMSFTVRQTPTEYDNVLLPHHVEVGLFDFDPKSAALKLRKAVPIDIRPVEEEQDFTDTVFGNEHDRTNPPDFVYVNFRELTLAKCMMDPKSLAFIATKIDKIIGTTKDDEGKADEDRADIILLIMQVLESFTAMLKNVMITPEKFVACMIPVCAGKSKAHAKVAIEIERELKVMLRYHNFIQANSSVLGILGKYCVVLYFTENNAEAGETALEIIKKRPEVADFAIKNMASGCTKEFSVMFWYSLASLAAWGYISSLEQFKAIVARYYKSDNVNGKDKLEWWVETIWKITRGTTDDAEELWDKSFAEDPSGNDFFEKLCYSGLFMAPCKARLMELIDRKSGTITVDTALKLVHACEHDAELVDKISKLKVCSESQEAQALISKVDTINKGIFLAKTKYEQLK